MLVKKVGRPVILEPTDEWPEDFLASLGAWDEEIERPVSRAVDETRDPFE